MIWILIGIGFLFIEALILHDAIRDEGQSNSQGYKSLGEPSSSEQDTAKDERGNQVATTVPARSINPKEDNPDTRDQSDKSSRAEKREHTGLEKIAFFVAIIAAIGTAFQAYVAQDSEKRSLRAYISILNAAIQPQSYPNGSTVVVQITIKNSGQTPAYDERSFIAIVVAPADADPFTFWPNLDDRPRHILGPNIESTLDNAINISATDLQDVMNGTKKMFVWGRVEYRDVFGQSRYMIFRDINGPWYGPPSNRWTAQAHPLGEEAN